MTYTFDPYNYDLLKAAREHQRTFSFRLGTNDFAELGISRPDDVAQIREGGRFDLTPWNGGRKIRIAPPPKYQMTPFEMLRDASFAVDYLYLQFDQAGGEDGLGDVSATYNPLETTSLRKVTLDQTVP